MEVAMFRTVIATTVALAAILVLPATAANADHKHKRHHHARAGPPDWAPAHGYRRKHKRKHHHRDYRYETYEYESYRHDAYPNNYAYNPLGDIGAGRCNRDAIGTLLGAATGGLLGSQIGDGTGQMAAVGAGVFLGAILGGSIGRQMDQVDQSCVGQVLEYAPDNQAVAWQNPNTDAYYTTTATNTYEQTGGRYCREYQTTSTVGGRVQNMYGTACRQPDGAWEIVN
jgi:surface antigen